jgi:hypothetical protein
MAKGRDANDVLREDGPDALRTAHDKAKRWHGKNRHQDHKHNGSENGALPILFGIEADQTARARLTGPLPAVGTALLVGQFGMAKTSLGLDLSAAVITSGTFAGAKVERPGGVLWFAAEGQQEIGPRLKALEIEKEVPIEFFARVESCPPFLVEGTPAILLATAREAAHQLMQRHSLALRLVIFDTIAAAAGWKDENSSAECQRVMNLLAMLAQELQCCVVGIDHLGKIADLGTRGNSAKEAAADVVLVILGDRDAAGQVKNLQLAVRKNRSGPTGAKYPFALRPVRLQSEETACVIDWGQSKPSGAAKGAWPKHLRVFRTALGNALAGNTKPLRPWHDGPEVQTTDIEHVRREFYELYPTTGETAKQCADARRKAFNRYTIDARERNLIGTLARDGIQRLWLTKDIPREAGNAEHVTGVT